ncbi:MAG: DUF2953 domain-containing protein [Gemmatimonadota bacterium]|nr:DUF2953 domain-containing protein [Gemmatimonadota bacterium]
MDILLLLLFLCFLIILAPVRLRVHGENGSERGPTLDIRLRTWIGLAGIRLFFTGGGWCVGALLGWWTVWTVPLRRGEGRKEKRGARVKDEAEADVSDGFSARVERFVRAGRRLSELSLPLRRTALRLLNGFRLRRIKCRVTFGASDPATTGRIYGYFVAASSLVGATGSVDVTPDFKTQRLDGEARVEIRIYPHRLLLATVYLGWHVALAWFSERRKRNPPDEGIIRAGATG